MKTPDANVLIIGGGISGLATAWWLAQEGVSVEIWEQDDQPGGKIRTHRRSGYLMERSASMVMNFRPEVNRFIEGAGLSPSKVSGPAKPTRYMLHQGRLTAVPGCLLSMAKSPLWSLKGRLRLALEPFIPAGGGPQESVAEFVRRRLGHEMLDKAIEPYVAGPLASDPEYANAYTVLPRLTALEQRYGSLGMGVFINKVLRRRTAAVTEAFSFQGGMSTLVKTLAATPGVRFCKGRRVTDLERCGEGWRVTCESANGRLSQTAGQVVLSLPAEQAAQIVKPLDGELAGRLSGIEYAPVSVVHVGLPRKAVSHSLNGNGFLLPKRQGAGVTGSLWMSSLFTSRAPQESVLLTNYLGACRRPEVTEWGDERTASEVLSTLKPLIGIKGEPDMIHIDRHERALPLYHGDYTARLAAIEGSLRSHEGLHLEANYRGGVSIRDRIACAYTTSREVLKRARRSGCHSEDKNLTKSGGFAAQL